MVGLPARASLADIGTVWLDGLNSEGERHTLEGARHTLKGARYTLEGARHALEGRRAKRLANRVFLAETLNAEWGRKALPQLIT